MNLNDIKYKIIFNSLKQLARLPHSVRYKGIGDMVNLVLRSSGYRQEVIRGNIKRVFPNLEYNNVIKLEQLFYKELAETIVDIISMCGISDRQILAQMRYTNYQEVESQMKGQSWISAMAHYAMWEYVANYALLTDHQVIAAYHRLSNSMFDRMMKQIRNRFGTIPVESNQLVKRIASGYQKKPMIIGIIADQVPPNYPSTRWFKFLGQDTKFFMGLGRIATKYHLPVYFLDIDKIKPGYYQGTFDLIYSGKESASAEEITARYVQKLESMIIRRPELWLWSHRRWKYDRNELG
jgi:KDO2-lipid IV(A) lauroyltransferase